MKSIDEIIPYVNNPRKNDNAVDKVASSIKNFGWKVPIVIDNNNEIVAGHTRYKAAKKLGIKEIPCVVADDLTKAQIKAYRIADNRVAEEATWDEELLKIEFEGIKDMDLDIALTGFDLEEIEKEILDYSDSNKEVDVSEFDEKITLSLKFSFEEYEKVVSFLRSKNEIMEMALLEMLEETENV